MIDVQPTNASNDRLRQNFKFSIENGRIGLIFYWLIASRHGDVIKSASHPIFLLLSSQFKMASFIPSKRGNPKLVFEYHCYTKEKNGLNGQRYWVCEQNNTRQCPGRAITDAENNVKVTVIHNHAESPTRIEVQGIKANIKTAATTSTATPRTLVNQGLAGISDRAKVVFTYN
jgi:hypothetical protein